jgi:poly-gamma-glutamate synthesis protein (capsule biosynthesis protein)
MRNGLRIGIINTTDASHYRAGPSAVGVHTLNGPRLCKQTRTLSETADLVVVVIHSDLEFTNAPAPWKVRLSRRLAENGAHLVIHHHPHTIQGIESYRGALIAYSLGNLLFPVHDSAYMSERSGNVDQGIFVVANVDVGQGGTVIEPEVIPIEIDSRNRLLVSSGEDRNRILGDLSDYSRLLESAPELRSRYLSRCLQEARRFLLGIYYRLAKAQFGEALRYVRAHLRTRMQRNWMRGLLTFGLR